ncbi:MAG: glycosyltransferase [Acidimicrobiales bacterium]
MRIALVHPTPPDGTVGGAERHWEALTARLGERGHDAELFCFPSHETTLREILDGYETFGRLEFGDHDLVITGKYPAWMLRHDRHVVYLIHTLRGLYDTYPRHLDELAATPEGREIARRLDGFDDHVDLIGAARLELDRLGDDHPLAALPGPLARWVVQRLDRIAFAPERVCRFAANSEVVASRPGYFPDLAPVLVSNPETNLPFELGTAPATPVFFTTSRHDGPKRLDLAIDAFATIDDPSARLRIGGSGPQRADLEARAAGDDRVTFLGRLSEERLAEEYAAATAVPFVPALEDFGLISLEAMRAGTPVVTTTDSGGAAELIEHGVSGMVVEPDPERIGWAMRHVAGSRYGRWQMGLNARRAAATVSWDTFCDEVEDLGTDVERPKVVMLSTYPVDPAIGGGQRRARFLARGLADRADVTVLVSSASVAGSRRRHLEPGLDQVEIGRSAAQLRAEEDMFHMMGMPVDDITAARLTPATPAFAAELERLLTDADLVIAVQPFLLPLVPPTDVPIVHDSQNNESAMKADLLPDSDAGHWFLDQARTVERAAMERAAVLTVCTDDDARTLGALTERDVPTLMVPNGVDTRALPFKEPDTAARARAELLGLAGAERDDDRPIALFIGSWHPPNIAAGRLILALAERRTDWLFVMAGSHTSEFAEDPVPSNVLLIPIFAEPLLWPLLAGATVALNPMVSGGGSNLKIFDYLSVGTPVLSTAIGARGLDDPDAVLRVVDGTPEAFADALVEVSAEIDAGDLGLEAQRHAGRDLVERSFDWEHLGRRWADGILTALELPVLPLRRRTRSAAPPILSDAEPPAHDPVIATMELLGQRARTIDPTPLDTTVDPALREHLKFADENRHVGRNVPPDARLRDVKRLAVRAGQIISNEQSNYNDAVLGALERLSTLVGDLRRDNEALGRRVAQLEQGGAATTPEPVAGQGAPGGGRLDDDPRLAALYQAFEDELRGSPAQVRASLGDHLGAFAHLAGSARPVLDVGAGPGTWVGLLGEHGIPAYGYDTNVAAVERAQAADLDVRLGDGIAHLESLPGGSLSGVSAFHVVEHLSFVDLARFVTAAAAAVAPGGIVVVETPNAENLQVSGTSFWLDPTHERPTHPDLLRFLFAQAGLVDVEVEGLHPRAEELAGLDDLADDPARNGLLSAMARLVFAPHDLAVRGRRPQ